MKTRRSLLVSWLLGASAVALLTLSFEGLSAREKEESRSPATGAISAATAPSAPAGPAARDRDAGRCPAAPAVVTDDRCPAAGRSFRRATPPPGCPAAEFGASAARTARLRV